ncbi:hypothetical protein [Arachnia propionica]|uniref:hypothetical protein n=1 Tax=Arachnia propionica TaxID=1750 RepID=UPI003C6F6C57
MSDESATFTINVDGCRYSVERPRLSGDDSQQDPDHAAVYTTMGDLVGYIEPLTRAWRNAQALVEEAGDE